MSAVIAMPAATRRDKSAPAASLWSSIHVTRDIDAAAGDWRLLEATGLVTPYQRLDWIAAYAANVGKVHGLDLRYITLRDENEQVIGLLPLEVLRLHGARVARFIGDKHANYHMALLDPAFAANLDKDGSEQLLRAVAARLGDVDAFVFTNQPSVWEGIANPFVLLAATQSPSHAYKLALNADCEATLNRSMSSHARKKLKNKRNRFADFGPSELVRARTPIEIEAVLDAFLVQKADRFAQMGVANPFADPAMRQFLREGAAFSDQNQTPAIELYGLELDGDFITTYVGAVQGRRFSGMATAYALNHPAAKTSPGEILLVDLIKLKCQEGFSVFDLGVGEARYKTTICDDKDELVDTFLGVTRLGQVLALVARLKRTAKRLIKKDPRLLKLAHAISGRFKRKPPKGPDGQ
jgi:CelD/BcsL family acetyltransferase involved in cellulose biosynthesis